MTTCHQCGSEVADNDVFCPYCGLSLQAVPVPAEEDEFASTIMMPQAEAASKVADLKNERHEELVIDGVEVPDEVDPEASVQQPDYNDLPTPPALQELESSSHAPDFSEPKNFDKPEGISDEDRTIVSLDEPQRFEPDTATERNEPATPFFGSIEQEPISTSTENFSG